jgi:hypothetical protein
MNISFDYDKVQAELAAPAAAPPSRVPEATSLGMPARRAPLPLKPNSQVQDATVYRDRALVTRVRTVDLQGGEGIVEFTGLPLGIRPESFQGGIAPGGAEVLAVERLTGQGILQRQEDQEAIRKELRPLVEQVGERRDRIEALLAQRAYLRGAVLPESQVAERTSVAELERTLAFVAKEEVRISKELRAEDAAVEELDRAVGPLLSRLADPLAEGETVRIRVRATRAGPASVTLRYQVWGASWTPAYRARVVGDGRAELDYEGVVVQETGEDWKDAALLLSTADASTPGSPPQISAWYLGEDASGAVADQMRKQSPWTPGARGPATGGGSGGSAVVFPVPGRWTVRGDGSEQRLPITQLAIEAPEERVTVPRAVPVVYRSLRATHGGAIPLLPGSVSLFVGPDMVAQSTLSGVAPGEGYVLHFGADEGMKVERTLLSRHREAVGLTGKSVRWTFQVEITVRDFAGRGRTVEVLDQIPVAESDRVTVKRTGDEPEAAGEGDPAGLLRWKVAVPAKGVATVRYGFSVTAPAEVGLPDLMML